VISIAVTTDPQLLAAAAQLRHQVFVEEQGIDPAIEFDGRDGGAAHVVLRESGRPGSVRVLGTARVFDEADQAVVGRVAVAADRRGERLGAQVMEEAERWAASRGIPRVELHAQQQVIGFYARLGYAGVGEPYEEAGIPHLTMRKDLLPGLRPVRDSDAAAIEHLIGTIWAEYPGVVLDVDGEEPWMRAPASAYDGSGGELFVVPAAEGEGLTASAGWKRYPGGAELKSLYVAAGSRRQGWGSRLVRFIERRVGGHRLTVWSDTRFTDSHAMYERLGYRRTGAARELHDRSQTVELEFVADPQRR
jgi:predicted GNAT family N-acyltransferase/RimJ/RimL family protein N-acetyltransferase